jgi:putative endonuclease
MATERVYYVYIMASYSRVLYVGVTNDIVRRVSQHKAGTGSVFTRRYKVTRLVYVAETSQVQEALEGEKRIKGLLRSKKVALIDAMNPSWRDLSEEWFGRD